MLSHMRTSIDIDDKLLRQAKRHALENDTTLKAIVEEGLRQVVHGDVTSSPRKPTPFKLTTFRGKGLQPGIREGDWETIRDLIYPARGIDDRD